MNLRFTTMTAVVALMLFTPIAAYPQNNPPAPPAAAAAQATPPAPPGTVAPSAVDTKSNTYTQQKLDQMLAPIALYPDQLVSQILMASTFPLQIVEAERWLDNPSNAALKGDALVAALQPMNWDPSVKSIAAFPAIVKMLNKNLDWTNSLGVAFANQQNDVMTQIQFLRHEAQKAGHLTSNDKIVCRDVGSNITIEPANPNVIYAPYYNPAVVYGTWPWAAYPPVYFSPAYYGLGTLGYDVAWAWGPAWPIVPAFWGWYGVNWGAGGGIYVNGGGYSRIAYGNAAWGGGNWQHTGGTVSHGGSGSASTFGTRTNGATHGSGGTRTSGSGTSTGGIAHAAGAGHSGGGGHSSGVTHASLGGGGHAGGGGRAGGGGGHAGGGGRAGGGGGRAGGGGGRAGGGGGHAGGGGGGHHG
jgi:hypothetical protein